MQFRKLALALPAVLALAAGQATLAHAQFTITANVTDPGSAPSAALEADPGLESRDTLLRHLPDALARKIRGENARALYRLSPQSA